MRHLLFVPKPEHAEALLSEGIGGSRPPTAVLIAPHNDDEWHFQSACVGMHHLCGKCGDTWPCATRRDHERPAAWQQANEPKPAPPTGDPALVLVWNGVVAVEGVDRIVRTLPEPSGVSLLRDYAVETALVYAQRAKRLGFGEIVEVED